MLSVTNLTLSYGGRALLQNVSFDLEPGCIMGLVAPNGYGKTTLLKAMANIKAARVTGAIAVDDLPANQVARRRARVFYAPGEGTLLYPGMTVGDHLAMTRKLWRSQRSIDDVARACKVDDRLVPTGGFARRGQRLDVLCRETDRSRPSGLRKEHRRGIERDLARILILAACHGKSRRSHDHSHQPYESFHITQIYRISI